MHTISSDSRQQLPEVLALQKEAYQSEATLCENPRFPPLTQTLPELGAEFDKGAVLVACTEAGEIIGSVRGFVENGTGYIGKLIVSPTYQGQGIGSALLSAIERKLEARRLELFTSAWSERNLGLYQRRGYRPFRETVVPSNADAPDLPLVFLEKTL